MPTLNKESLVAFFEAHSTLRVVLIAAAVCAGLLLTFWFIAFSGISSSADFIYSQF
jgi:general stress protein CsbA